jgi:hypothetical protein
METRFPGHQSWSPLKVFRTPDFQPLAKPLRSYLSKIGLCKEFGPMAKVSLQTHSTKTRFPFPEWEAWWYLGRDSNFAWTWKLSPDHLVLDSPLKSKTSLLIALIMYSFISWLGIFCQATNSYTLMSSVKLSWLVETSYVSIAEYMKESVSGRYFLYVLTFGRNVQPANSSRAFSFCRALTRSSLFY